MIGTEFPTILNGRSDGAKLIEAGRAPTETPALTSVNGVAGVGIMVEGATERNVPALVRRISTGASDGDSTTDTAATSQEHLVYKSIRVFLST